MSDLLTLTDAAFDNLVINMTSKERASALRQMVRQVRELQEALGQVDLGEWEDDRLREWLPAAAREIGAGSYYRHMTEPVRVVETASGRAGKDVARYVSEKADHFAHAENYCWVASQSTKNPALGFALGVGVKGW